MAKIVNRFGTWKIIAAIVAVICIVWLIYHATAGSKTSYQTVGVTRGTITEIVSVTGNTTPVKSLNLGFQNAGSISAVYKDVGAAVNPGDVIAQLDTQDLQAQQAQARASVDAQAATLKNLQAGPTPQSVAVSQTALASAQQTLANTYLSVENTLAASYAGASDAVRNQLSAFFSQAESNSPQLTFSTTNSQLMNNLILERIKASTELNTWQTELQVLSAAFPAGTL